MRFLAAWESPESHSIARHDSVAQKRLLHLRTLTFQSEVGMAHALAEKVELDTDQAQQLAIDGGVRCVTESMPAWPRPNEEEAETVRENILKAGGNSLYMCAASKGGPGGELEKIMQGQLEVPFAVATAGGGPALHIACMSAIEMGDEVIATPYSWGQSVSCILQAGGIPIFADIDPRTLTLDPQSIEKKITPHTKAIVVVHIFGIPADMDAILQVAGKHQLCVIEDCAQAHGSLYRGKPVGAFGDFGCFSLGSSKNIAAGDAGVLVTGDRDYYERALLAGMHPARTGVEIEDPERRQWIDSLIYTYRVNALSAGLAVKMMDRFEDMNRCRRRNVQSMKELLEGVPGIKPVELPQHCDPAWHMCPWTFVAEEVPGVSREQYLKALKAEGIPISGSYVGTPIHLRRTFREKRTHFGRGYPWSAHPHPDSITYHAGDCSVAERRCAEQDMMMLGSAACVDITPLLHQIAGAFRKVTSNLDVVRNIET